MQRREFLKLSGATVAISVLPGLAAEDGEQLRIAALSDIHIYDWGSSKKCNSPGEHGTLRSALIYLRDRKVDAVTISGDLVGANYKKELAILGRLWREAFPDNKRPDGGRVEPIFIYGNHDGLLRSEEGQAVFKRECGLTWAPIYSVKVKGYAFICASWGFENQLPAYIREHEAELGLRENRPFFCLMHPYPRHTMQVDDIDFDSERGTVTECLRDYPNAVVLCGHVHRASADDRSIWQGDFTALDCGTFGYFTHTQHGCENSRSRPKGKVFHMPRTETFGKQGMILEVRPDRIEVERRDFLYDVEIAPRCVLRRPVKGETPAFAYSEQTKRSVPPAWPEGAKIEVFERTGADTAKHEERQVVVRFPAASAAGHYGRPLRYRVEVTDGGKTLLTRGVVQAEYYKPLDRFPKTQDCVFGADEIPAGVTPTYRVTPVGVFGKEGAPLEGAGK